jgi:amidohydrolase
VWGNLHAGGAQNVIPSTGTVSGTLRMLDADAWAQMGSLVEDLVEAVVAPYGVSAKVEHVRGVPPVVNDQVSVDVVSAAARAVLGPDSVQPTRQSLGGEDFAWYLTTLPGAMVRLGTRTPGGRTYDLHQGDLMVDEDAIAAGAKLLAASALGCSRIARRGAP